MKKGLDNFQALQLELIKEQEEQLAILKKFLQVKAKAHIVKHGLQPTLNGIVKSSGKKCLIYTKANQQPQEVKYAVKDLGEEYFLRQQKVMLDNAEKTAQPQTGVNTEPQEPKLDDSTGYRLESDIGKSGKKEWSKSKKFV
jgi:hypothetical protein